MLCLLLIFYFVQNTNAELFVTACTDGGGECDQFPNSVCDTAVTLVCICPGGRGFIANSARTRCDYSCGELTSPAGGTVSTTATITDGVATYTCNPGFILIGVNTRTCVLSAGWNSSAPTCLAGKLGDDCSSKTDVCDNIVHGYCVGGSCTCSTGHQDDGTTMNCTDINECVPDPCLNGTTCVNGFAEYTCQCAVGWTGTNCEIDINECASLPCKNGATCTHGLDTYQCTCAPGYIGVNCDTDIYECTSTPCINGGTCVDVVNGYICVCVPGYTGAQCQTDINECVPDLCLNGATCVNGLAKFTCQCAVGWAGTNCETDINECASLPCKNGETCKHGLDTYQCTCAPGYAGVNCDTDINECASSPCKNGATCNDNVASFTCSCASGYTGQFCDTETVSHNGVGSIGDFGEMLAKVFVMNVWLMSSIH